MKIVVYGPGRRVGILHGDNVVDVHLANAKYLKEAQDEPLPYAMSAAFTPTDLQEFIESGPRAIESAQKALEYLTSKAGDQLGPRGESIVTSLSQAQIHAPLPSRSSRLAMAGGNFKDHIFGMLARRNPSITMEQAVADARESGIWGFWKLAQNVIAPDEELVYPSKTQRLDYEGEVSIILSKPAKDVPESRVKDYIWGYTLQNDWSLRDQRENGGFKFVMAKNFDGSSTLGPCIVVGEISDPQDVDFATHVNGEQRQKGNTRDMIFSFGEFLEYLTRDSTLLPGDLISGGTCAGTAADATTLDADGKPVRNLYAQPGDLVELSSTVIGTLRTRVVARK